MSVLSLVFWGVNFVRKAYRCQGTLEDLILCLGSSVGQILNGGPSSELKYIDYRVDHLWLYSGKRYIIYCHLYYLCLKYHGLYEKSETVVQLQICWQGRFHRHWSSNLKPRMLSHYESCLQFGKTYQAVLATMFVWVNGSLGQHPLLLFLGVLR